MNGVDVFDSEIEDVFVVDVSWSPLIAVVAFPCVENLTDPPACTVFLSQPNVGLVSRPMMSR